MTDLITGETAPSAAPAPTVRRSLLRRRTILGAVLLVLLIAGIATGATLRHLDRQYGPLQPGSFGGAYALSDWRFSKDGFSFSLPPAPQATGRLISSLDNAGAHSVKITAIDHGPLVSDIRWSSYRLLPDSSLEGAATPWRRFPAVVPAHGTIRLLITVHHPANCSAYTKADQPVLPRYGGYHRVHWDSLLDDHVSWLDLYGLDMTDEPTVC